MSVGLSGRGRPQSISQFKVLKGCWMGEMLRGGLVLAALCNMAGDASAHTSLSLRGSGAAAASLLMPRARLMRLRGGIGVFPNTASPATHRC